MIKTMCPRNQNNILAMEKQTKTSHESPHTSEPVVPNMIPSSSGDESSSSSDETHYQSRSPLHYHDENIDPSHHHGQELHRNNHHQHHHHHHNQNHHHHHNHTKKSKEETLPSKNNLSTTTRSEVRFSTIEIRSFPIILGDNPACDQYGPPLTIDWEPESTKKVQVDIYEEFRGRFGNGKGAGSSGNNTHRRRRLHDLKIGGFFRTRILRRSGVCTKEEIQKRMDEMSMIRQSRNRSKKWYFWQERLKEYLFPNAAKGSCVAGSSVTRSSI